MEQHASNPNPDALGQAQSVLTSLQSLLESDNPSREQVRAVATALRETREAAIRSGLVLLAQSISEIAETCESAAQPEHQFPSTLDIVADAVSGTKEVLEAISLGDLERSLRPEMLEALRNARRNHTAPPEPQSIRFRRIDETETNTRPADEQLSPDHQTPSAGEQSEAAATHNQPETDERFSRESDSQDELRTNDATDSHDTGDTETLEATELDRSFETETDFETDQPVQPDLTPEEASLAEPIDTEDSSTDAPDEDAIDSLQNMAADTEPETVQNEHLIDENKSENPVSYDENSSHTDVSDEQDPAADTLEPTKPQEATTSLDNDVETNPPSDIDLQEPLSNIKTSNAADDVPEAEDDDTPNDDDAPADVFKSVTNGLTTDDEPTVDDPETETDASHDQHPEPIDEQDAGAPFESITNGLTTDDEPPVDDTETETDASPEQNPEPIDEEDADTPFESITNGLTTDHVSEDTLAEADEPMDAPRHEHSESAVEIDRAEESSATNEPATSPEFASPENGLSTPAVGSATSETSSTRQADATDSFQSRTNGLAETAATSEPISDSTDPSNDLPDDPFAGDMPDPNQPLDPFAGDMPDPNQPLDPFAGDMPDPNQPLDPFAGDMPDPNQPLDPFAGDMPDPNQPLDPFAGGTPDPNQPLDPFAGGMPDPNQTLDATGGFGTTDTTAEPEEDYAPPADARNPQPEPESDDPNESWGSSPLILSPDKAELLQFMVSDIRRSVEEIEPILTEALDFTSRTDSAHRLVAIAGELGAVNEHFEFKSYQRLLDMLKLVGSGLGDVPDHVLGELLLRVRAIMALFDQFCSALEVGMELRWPLNVLDRRIRILLSGRPLHEDLIGWHQNDIDRLIELDRVTEGVDNPPVPESDAAEGTVASVPSPTSAGSAPTSEAKAVPSIRVPKPALEDILSVVRQLVLNKNQVHSLAQAAGSTGLTSEDAEAFELRAHEYARLVEQLQVSVNQTRIQPVGIVLERYERVVRDVAQIADKSASLLIEGGDTRIDKFMLDAIADPIGRLLRHTASAVIEPCDDRENFGKPKDATITVTVDDQGSHVVITITDDGSPPDPDTIRDHARNMDAFSESADSIPEAELLTLPLRAGYPSETAGIAETIEKLGGRVQVMHEEGINTSRFTLPVHGAVLGVMHVRIGESAYAIPVQTIGEIVNLAENPTETVKGHPVLRLRDRVIAVVECRTLFEKAPPGTGGFAVVVEAEGQSAALRVDRVLGHQEIVIESMGLDAHDHGPFLGATIKNDGNVALVIDAARTIEAASTLARGTQA